MSRNNDGLPMLPPWLSESDVSQSGYEAPVENLPHDDLIPEEKSPRRLFGRRKSRKDATPDQDPTPTRQPWSTSGDLPAPPITPELPTETRRPQSTPLPDARRAPSTSDARRAPSGPEVQQGPHSTTAAPRIPRSPAPTGGPANDVPSRSAHDPSSEPPSAAARFTTPPAPDAHRGTPAPSFGQPRPSTPLPPAPHTPLPDAPTQGARPQGAQPVGPQPGTRTQGPTSGSFTPPTGAPVIPDAPQPTPAAQSQDATTRYGVPPQLPPTRQETRPEGTQPGIPSIPGPPQPNPAAPGQDATTRYSAASAPAASVGAPPKPYIPESPSSAVQPDPVAQRPLPESAAQSTSGVPSQSRPQLPDAPGQGGPGQVADPRLHSPLPPSPNSAGTPNAAVGGEQSDPLAPQQGSSQSGRRPALPDAPGEVAKNGAGAAGSVTPPPGVPDLPPSPSHGAATTGNKADLGPGGAVPPEFPLPGTTVDDILAPPRGSSASAPAPQDDSKTRAEAGSDVPAASAEMTVRVPLSPATAESSFTAEGAAAGPGTGRNAAPGGLPDPSLGSVADVPPAPASNAAAQSSSSSSAAAQPDSAGTTGELPVDSGLGTNTGRHRAIDVPLPQRPGPVPEQGNSQSSPYGPRGGQGSTPAAPPSDGRQRPAPPTQSPAAPAPQGTAPHGTAPSPQGSSPAGQPSAPHGGATGPHGPGHQGAHTGSFPITAPGGPGMAAWNQSPYAPRQGSPAAPQDAAPSAPAQGTPGTPPQGARTAPHQGDSGAPPQGGATRSPLGSTRVPGTNWAPNPLMSGPNTWQHPALGENGGDAANSGGAAGRNGEGGSPAVATSNGGPESVADQPPGVNRDASGDAPGQATWGAPGAGKAGGDSRTLGQPDPVAMQPDSGVSPGVADGRQSHQPGGYGQPTTSGYGYADGPGQGLRPGVDGQGQHPGGYGQGQLGANGEGQRPAPFVEGQRPAPYVEGQQPAPYGGSQPGLSGAGQQAGPYGPGQQAGHYGDGQQAYSPGQQAGGYGQPGGYVPPSAPLQFGVGRQGQPLPSLDDVPLRRAKKAPGSGWRRAVHHVSGGAINPGLSAEERRLQELVARIRQPVRGDYRIAVLSLKGGVGKTTTTMGLGSIFSSIRGDRVIAVDANPDFGTLSQRVPLQTRSTVRDLLLDPGIQRYSDVRRHTSQAGSRLEVLASERDPAASEAFSEDEYRSVARILQRFYNIILTDCGTGLMHSAMAGVLDLAHSLVLISSSAIDGARSAAATLDWLSLHGHDHLVRNAVVVINLPRPGAATVGINQLRDYFLSRCRAVHIIPYDSHLGEGAEIDLTRLQKDTKRAYVELAATVADDFATDHRRYRG